MCVGDWLFAPQHYYKLYVRMVQNKVAVHIVLQLQCSLIYLCAWKALVLLSLYMHGVARLTKRKTAWLDFVSWKIWSVTKIGSGGPKLAAKIGPPLACAGVRIDNRDSILSLLSMVCACCVHEYCKSYWIQQQSVVCGYPIPSNSVLLPNGMWSYVLSVYEFRVHYLHNYT